MGSERPIDYGGRGLFLQAAQEIWNPKPLQTLESARAVVVRWLELKYPEQMMRHPHRVRDGLEMLRLWRTPWRFRWSTLCEDQGEEAMAARSSLEHWRWGHPISPDDCWIMDAAIHAIAYSHRMQGPLEWAYSPDEQIVAPFQANLPPWNWHPQRGEKEADRMERKLVALLRRQVRQYRTRIKKHYGELKPRGRQANKDNRTRDAIWTAKACAGKSPYEISKEAWVEEKAAGIAEGQRTQGEDTVRLAIKRFAAGIRLHLPRAAPGGRGTPLQPSRPRRSGTTTADGGRR